MVATVAICMDGLQESELPFARSFWRFDGGVKSWVLGEDVSLAEAEELAEWSFLEAKKVSLNRSAQVNNPDS